MYVYVHCDEINDLLLLLWSIKTAHVPNHTQVTLFFEVLTTTRVKSYVLHVQNLWITRIFKVHEIVNLVLLWDIFIDRCKGHSETVGQDDYPTCQKRNHQQFFSSKETKLNYISRVPSKINIFNKRFCSEHVSTTVTCIKYDNVEICCESI